MGVTTTTNSANTYVPIATTTLGTAAASYTFSSIPATYTDLVLVFQGTWAVSESAVIQLNGDTATNYSWISAQATSSNTTASQRSSSATNIATGGVADLMGTTVPSVFTSHFPGYSKTTINKTVISRAGNWTNSTTFGVNFIAGLWRSTAAINSIKVFSNSAHNLNAGSTLTLYGILAA